MVEDAVRGHGRAASLGGYVRPIAIGLVILAAGVIPGTVLGQMNARVRPDVPWAAIITFVYLAVLLAWLNGVGPPSRTAQVRRQRLRLWPPAQAVSGDLSAGAAAALLVLLGAVWIAMTLASPVPDLSAYPTTAYRWSMFLMGGITAGVVEEAAFRGYMQSGLEAHDRENAIWITSAVFVLAHLTHGIGAVLTLGPGMFVASMLYVVLARRTGTILPGMVIHASVDLARVYFGVLRGDASLLFVS